MPVYKRSYTYGSLITGEKPAVPTALACARAFAGGLLTTGLTHGLDTNTCVPIFLTMSSVNRRALGVGSTFPYEHNECSSVRCCSVACVLYACASFDATNCDEVPRRNS